MSRLRSAAGQLRYPAASATLASQDAVTYLLDLIRCAPPPREEERHLWLLTHERVRHNPAVRAVIDFLYERLINHVHRIADQPKAA